MVRRSLAAVLSAGALTLAACAGDDLDSSAGDDTGSAAGGGPVTIASQSFPEAALMASMYELLLADAGYEPTVQLVDSRDAYMATFPGDVDVVPEYVGGIVNFLNSTSDQGSGEQLTAGDGEELAEAGEDLLDEAGIELLELSEATDTNAYFVTVERAEEESWEVLSDLEGESVVLAAAPDCEGRLDCEAGLREEYGIDITKVLPLGYAGDQTYQSVLDGESDLGQTSTTDGTLESLGLVVLDDDQEIQPAQNLVPAVAEDFLEQNEGVADVLEELMAALDTDTLTELNGRMAVDREKPEDVARDFLESEGLL
ncbi:osmoprotectant transport system substrate-binding protein [Nocardioides salarius]|uniref:Osmoprotectant transport system substrate-binding protein n=1 Tax=Nocardioides salarius TaxID=374513 RepID=A0ABS2M974_9ACTN|nr:ABC transporter substrate-binding protein [Nocardioides salarius]MBM7507754.1 osmoprotectant transport system substrate-binding protein [Nocardioides salarius]